MTDSTITVTQGSGTSLKTDLVGGVHTPFHIEDATQRAALLAAFAGLGTQTTLAAILAKLLTAPATEAKQDTGNTSLATIAGKDFATQTTLAAILAKIIAAPATEAKQDTLNAAALLIGTRTYGAAATRVSVSGTSAQSAAITGTEVLLHASTRCFVAAGSNPTATTNDIPLESGEKFHMRITSGHKIAVLQDSASGYLNVVPVA